MQPISTQTDNMHAFGFQQGDELALSWFFKRLYSALCIYATRFTGNEEASKEIVSGAFYKTWKQHSQFTSANSIRLYLYTIVRHDAARFHQKEQRVIRLHQTSAQNQPSQDNIFDSIIKAETAHQLYAAIEMLPKKCRNIFRLLYVEGKSVNETATELNIAASTVRAQKIRGLNTLRRKANLTN